jgi:hypothetical protein
MEQEQTPVFDDAFFQSYANEIKADQEKKGGSGGFTREYEEIAFAGC